MAQIDETNAAEVASRLAGDLSAVASSELDLKRQLMAAHQAIGARDAGLEPLVQELQQTRRQRDEAYAELAAMRRTRLWRAGATWWWLRDALRRGRVR
jgi:hypothetical protein